MILFEKLIAKIIGEINLLMASLPLANIFIMEIYQRTYQIRLQILSDG